MSNSTFSPIPPSQIGGTITIDVFAVISALALLPLAFRVVWLAIQRPWSKSASQSEYDFFHTQLGQYVGCLIIAMLANTLSGLLGIAWASMRGIEDGPLCRAQALFMAFGTVSSGYFTVAIAVHSFLSLVLHKRQSAIICRSIIAGGWLLSLLMATIPFGIRFPEGSAYGPDGIICGIRSIFPKLQFFFHLLPILFCSFFGAILYSLKFLVLRGTVKISEGIGLTLDPTERWANRKKDDENYRRFVAQLSRSMLCYPVAYAALLVPYSMVRMFALSGFPVSFESMVFAFVCFHLHGVVSVPLLYNTSRLLGKAFGDTASISTSQKDLESAVSEDRKENRSSYPPDEQLAVSFPQVPTPSTLWSPENVSEVESRYTPSPVTFPAPSLGSNQTSAIDLPLTGLEPIHEESFTNAAPVPMMRRPSQATPRDVSFIEEFPPLPDVQPQQVTIVEPPPPVRPLNLSRRPTGLPANPRPPRVQPPSFIANRSRSSQGSSTLVREPMSTTWINKTTSSELTYLQDPSK